ncbi:MAG: sensor histidine kinase [Bacteroidales bacterium]
MKPFVVFIQRYKLHHLLFWAVYYVGWVQAYTDYYERRSDVLIITLLYALAHATMFYTTQYVLIPRLLRRRRIVAFILVFVVLLIATTGALYGGITLVLGSLIRWGVTPMQFMSTLAISSIFMTGVLLSIKGLFDYNRNIRQQQRLEKERLEAELQYLKAQVNPHFLFNTINSVYVLIRQNPEKASETLIRLSDLLRAQLYDFSTEKISIEQEVEYLDNYIELERVRKGDQLMVEVHKGDHLQGFSIAPLMLIPFLENCFKHVAQDQGLQRKIRFELLREQDQLIARFFNSRNSSFPGTSTQAGGLGLKNIQRRLALLYPGKHTLHINAQPDFYEVTLSLKLT